MGPSKETWEQRNHFHNSIILSNIKIIQLFIRRNDKSIIPKAKKHTYNVGSVVMKNGYFPLFVVIIALCILPVCIYWGITDYVSGINLFNSPYTRPVGVMISIISLWLMEAGLLGREKLDRWEARILSLINMSKVNGWMGHLDNRMHGFVDKYTIPFMKIFIFLLSGAMVFYFLDKISFNFSNTVDKMLLVFMSLSGFSVVILGLVTILLSTWGYPVMIIIWLLQLPFKAVQKFNTNAKLENVFKFTGLILGTIAILLLDLW